MVNIINDIISAICVKLYNAFGDGYDIYTENVEQGFNEPCFFVSSASAITNHFRNNVYVENNLFSITYFPSTKDKAKECNNVREKLYDLFEFLEFQGSLLGGKDMEGIVQDDVLVFTVNYDFFTLKEMEKEKMEDLKYYG